MDIKEYIASGVIEDYCLGVLDAEMMQIVAQNAALYPEIQDEIDACEMALATYAAEFATGKKELSKDDVLMAIESLENEEQITLDNVPLITKYSDATNWLKFVKPLLPQTLTRPFWMYNLPGDEDVERFVLWSHGDIPHETHTHTQETFLVLEGRCRCFMNEEAVELSAGDFLSIPLYAEHNVEILEGPVMAIVQRVKVA